MFTSSEMWPVKASCLSRCSFVAKEFTPPWRKPRALGTLKLGWVVFRGYNGGSIKCEFPHSSGASAVPGTILGTEVTMVYWFPRVALPKCHKWGDLKQQKSIPSRFLRQKPGPKLWSQLWSRAMVPKIFEGESFLASSSFWGLPQSSTFFGFVDTSLPSLVCVMTWHSPWVSPFLLIGIPVI